MVNCLPSASGNDQSGAFMPTLSSSAAAGAATNINNANQINARFIFGFPPSRVCIDPLHRRRKILGVPGGDQSPILAM
jgi:hypothetical protein